MEEGSHSSTIIHWMGLDFDYWIILMSVLASGIIIFLAWLGSRRCSLIPKGWQAALEMMVEFIESPVKDSMGHRGVKYVYFFGSLFLFIIVSNMLGLIPRLSSPTRDVSVTLSLAVLTIIWMQYISVREIGFRRHLSHFIAPNIVFLPIHLLELVTRPLTLAMRLFGNIFAGEILIEVLTKIAPYGVPSLWLMISVAIGAIQAYIFTLLGIAYTGLAIADSEH